MSLSATAFSGTNLLQAGTYTGNASPIIGNAHRVSNYVGEIAVLADVGPVMVCNGVGTIALRIETSSGSLPTDTWVGVSANGTYPTFSAAGSLCTVAIDHADCERYVRVYGESKGLFPVAVELGGMKKATD